MRRLSVRMSAEDVFSIPPGPHRFSRSLRYHIEKFAAQVVGRAFGSVFFSPWEERSKSAPENLGR